MAHVAQAYRTAHEVIAGAMGLGLLAGAGAWLDHRFGWSPVLTISGACVGMVFAGASLRQLMRRLDQETAQAKRQNSEDRKNTPGS